MAACSQTTLSNAFSWMKIMEFLLKFHWSWSVPSHHLDQWWLDHWRIYASLGLNELMNVEKKFHWNLNQLQRISSKKKHFKMSTILSPPKCSQLSRAFINYQFYKLWHHIHNRPWELLEVLLCFSTCRFYHRLFCQGYFTGAGAVVITEVPRSQWWRVGYSFFLSFPLSF